MLLIALFIGGMLMSNQFRKDKSTDSDPKKSSDPYYSDRTVQSASMLSRTGGGQHKCKKTGSLQPLLERLGHESLHLNSSIIKAQCPISGI
jgi:hypothetical protein